MRIPSSVPALCTLIVLLVYRPDIAAQEPSATIRMPPTPTNSTLLRGGPGAYLHNRGGGKLHSGVDIVANQSTEDRSAYRVMAVSDGKVAYARINGGDETGYGYTIVIDHENGVYTQYSHLATVASSGLVSVGDLAGF